MTQYDHQGRMLYNPKYHKNHGKPWKVKELIYLCSMAETMRAKDLAMALGRTEMTVSTKTYDLRHLLTKTKEYGEISMYEFYKRLDTKI